MHAVWFNSRKFEDAETLLGYHLSGKKAPKELLASLASKESDHSSGGSAVSASVENSLKLIQEQLQGIQNRLAQLELRAVVGEQVQELEAKLAKLEVTCSSCPPQQPTECPKPAPVPVATTTKAPAAAADDDDDDFELFGDEEEDKAKKENTAKLVAEYAAKKAKKRLLEPALVAKSNIILDVKPWDDTTDMKQIEDSVRSISMDGLLWGASKLVPLAYGIRKLQISCVVEDDLVSVDLLEEKITEFDELVDELLDPPRRITHPPTPVQSVDIAAFNKI